MTGNQFTKTVYTYKRDDKGNFVLNDDKQKIVDKEIGQFTFKRPTVRDELDMRIERKKLLKGEKIEDIDDMEKLFLEYCVYFPRLAVDSPRGWDWDYVSDTLVMLAVTEAFVEGFSEIE